MSNLNSPGRAKIYNNDGTGRDSYVSLNSGGFTVNNLPAVAPQTSNFIISPTVRRGPSAAIQKPVLYQTNGGGRDGYIVKNSGGFTANYGKYAAGDAYVKSLREYESPIMQDTFATSMRRAPGTEQFGVTSPRARQALKALHFSQQVQIERLSMPRQKSLKHQSSEDGFHSPHRLQQSPSQSSLNGKKAELVGLVSPRKRHAPSPGPIIQIQESRNHDSALTSFDDRQNRRHQSQLGSHIQPKISGITSERLSLPNIYGGRTPQRVRHPSEAEDQYRSLAPNSRQLFKLIQQKQGRADPALIGSKYAHDELTNLGRQQKNMKPKPFETIHIQGGNKYDEMLQKAAV